MDMDVTTMNGPYWKVTGKSGWQKLTVKFDGSVPLNALKELVGKETTGLAYSREKGRKVLKIIGDSVHAPKSGWKTRQYLILPEAYRMTVDGPYVDVGGSEHPLTVNADGTISLAVLQRFVSTATGLKYSSNGKEKVLNFQGQNVSAPKHGWKRRNYTFVSEGPPSKRTKTSNDTTATTSEQEEAKKEAKKRQRNKKLKRFLQSRRQIQQTQCDIKAQEQEVLQLESGIQIKVDEEQEEEAVIVDKKAEVKSKIAEINDMKAEIKGKIAEIKSKEAEIKQCGKLKDKVKQLTKDKDEVLKQITALQNQLTALQNQLTALQNQLSQLQNQLSQLQAQQTALITHQKDKGELIEKFRKESEKLIEKFRKKSRKESEKLIEKFRKKSTKGYAQEERKKYNSVQDIMSAIQKQSDYTGIDKSSLDNAVQNTCQVGQILKLTADRNSDFYQIYIRYDYVNILKKIETKVKEGVQRFIITGSSGIGKSCCIGFFIVQLLKSNYYTVIVYSELGETDHKTDYYVITKDYIKRADELLIHILLTTAPMDGLNIMWLMDAKQHGPYRCLNSNVIVVLFASFSDKNYKDFQKHSGFIPTIMYMPWWSQTDEGELVGLHAHLIPDEELTDSTTEDSNQEHLKVKAAIYQEFLDMFDLYSCQNAKSYKMYEKNYQLAGPNPRFVFKTTDFNTLKHDIRLKLNSRTTDLQLAHLAYSSEQHAEVIETEDASSKIFCVIIERENYQPTGKVVYVSQFACYMLSDKLKSQSYNDQIKYLTSRRIPDDSIKFGQTFECHMHTYLNQCTSKSFVATRLNPPRTLHSPTKKTAKLTLPSFHAIKHFLERDVNLTPYTYYQPMSRQHISVDSFYVDGMTNTLNFFQFTTREYHPVMAQGLQSLIANGNYGTVNLIFVVPDVKYCLPNKQCIMNEQTLTNKKTQRHTELPVETYSNLLSVIKQWKLIVDIEKTRNVCTF